MSNEVEKKETKCVFPPPFIRFYVIIFIYVIIMYISVIFHYYVFAIIIFIIFTFFSNGTKCQKCQKSLSETNSGDARFFTLLKCDKCGQNLMKCKIDEN